MSLWTDLGLRSEDKQKAIDARRQARFDTRMKSKLSKSGSNTDEALTQLVGGGASNAAPAPSSSNVTTIAIVLGGVAIVGTVVFMLVKSRK